MLLDTCALIWLAMGGGPISGPALDRVNEADTLAVSSISAFEISHLYNKGKLGLPCDPEKWFYEVLACHDIMEVKLDSKIAIASSKLPEHHRDPCDRFITATAILQKWPVVIKDRRFERYGVEVVG